MKTQQRRRRTKRERARRRSGVQKGAAALAAGAAIAAGTQAYAGPVRFDNPAHGQPGHFEWISNTGFPGIGLDPTLAAGSQTGAALGDGQFHQSNFGYKGFVGTSTASAGEVEVGGLYDLFLLGANPGDLIPRGLPWQDFGYAYYPGYGYTQLPPEGQPTYLGLRFPIGGNTHYGWIGVVRQNTTELEAFAWGYETDAGVPIAAGVPEPGSLALLAFGAAGLAATRRRRGSAR